ncbi:MAG: hypothetical protein DRI01_09390 [Chloroflexi bacterium]|nr:MAG: hypothetical protein DRI01_09390 [Chloroflexota bacterium]
MLFEVEMDSKVFKDLKEQEPYYADMTEADILEELIEMALEEGCCLTKSYQVKVRLIGQTSQTC